MTSGGVRIAATIVIMSMANLRFLRKKAEEIRPINPKNPRIKGIWKITPKVNKSEETNEKSKALPVLRQGFTLTTSLIFNRF